MSTQDSTQNAGQRLAELLALSRELGLPERRMAILGEGNTSTRIDAETFLVKASGSSLSTLSEADVVACRFAPLLALLERSQPSDDEVDETLLASRIDPAARKPSVEAVFHAWLLSQPGVDWVGHTHPVTINSILCSPRAREFADHRLCPDEVVCCGPASVFVPYTDPGLALARAIRRGTEQFRATHHMEPRVVLLQNHGIITFGPTAAAVRAAMSMTEKAASIFLGAAALGGPCFLRPEDIARIGGRRDEHYRQRALNL